MRLQPLVPSFYGSCWFHTSAVRHKRDRSLVKPLYSNNAFLTTWCNTRVACSMTFLLNCLLIHGLSGLECVLSHSSYAWNSFSLLAGNQLWAYEKVIRNSKIVVAVRDTWTQLKHDSCSKAQLLAFLISVDPLAACLVNAKIHGPRAWDPTCTLACVGGTAESEICLGHKSKLHQCSACFPEEYRAYFPAKRKFISTPSSTCPPSPLLLQHRCQ